MTIKPFTLGKIDMFDDPDAGNAKLEHWLNKFLPLYLESPEFKGLSKANKKAGGDWFATFMDLSLNYVTEDLKNLDLTDAKEIMLNLYPRKMICSDTQAKTIIPDILACWQFLRRELNSGKRKGLKHADEVIEFLESIKKDYLKIYNGHYQGNVARGMDLDINETMQGVPLPTNDEGHKWVNDLIEESSADFTHIRNSHEPPESWLSLCQHHYLAEFLQQVCLNGYDETLPNAQDVVTELLSFGLRELFMHIRQGDQDAKNFWQDTEHNIMGAGDHDGLRIETMNALVPVLSSHKQFLSAEFITFLQDWHFDNIPGTPLQDTNPEAFQEMLLEMVKDVPDEFTLASILTEQMGLLPAEGLQLMAGLLMVTGDKAADGVALMLLDDNHGNAQAIAEVLEMKPGVISAKSLSRLIRVRNWLSNTVQKPVDQLVRTVRKTGLAPLPPAPLADKDIQEVYMSGVDGSGAQGVTLLVRDSSAFRMISFIFKEAVGVVDVLVTPPTTKTELKEYISAMKSQVASMEKVSVELVRKQLPYFIALNLKSKVAIDHELVQVMELLGLEDWHPEQSNLSTLFEGMVQVPPSPEEIETVQRRSRNWVNQVIGDSWFEMPDKLQHLGSLTHQNYLKIFTEVMEAQRPHWGERMGRMALWCKHAENKRRQGQARDFAVVSWLLKHSDLPAQEINLIDAIVKKSL